MPDIKKPLTVASGRKRLRELREKKAQREYDDSPDRTYFVVILNLTIEIASAIIVVVGVFFLFRFFMQKRSDVDPLLFRLCLGCMVVFIVGWLMYLGMRLRKQLALLKSLSSK